MTTPGTSITVEATVNASIEKVWEFWGGPEHIVKWSHASDDWHTPYAENDLKTGGKFLSRMATKDGSFSFDFGGVYDEVEDHKSIAYSMADGRKVKITFEADGDATKVTETFDPENEHPADFQKAGWQAILDNFKKYAEAQG